MKTSNIIYILLPLILLGLMGCGQEEGKEEKSPSREKLLSNIEGLKKELYDTSKTASRKNTRITARNLARNYLEFASDHPGDERTPSFLYQAAGLNRGNGRYRKALNLYEKIRQEHPGFEKQAECLFLQAFIHDQDLNNKDSAKVLYQQVIEEYPDHKFAQDAKARIETLHLSDEELIERFEKMNEEKSQ